MNNNELKNRNGKKTSKEGQPINHTLKKKSKKRKQYELKPIDREELRQLIIAEPNISHIAKYFGVSRSTIRTKIHLNGLEVVREISEENHKKLLAIEEKELTYCRLYMQLNSIRKIAKEFHTSSLKVKAALIKYNIDISESGKWTKFVHHIKDKNFDIPISDKLNEMIISQILGDASLRIMKKGDLSYPDDLDFGEYSTQKEIIRSFLLMETIEITEENIKKYNYAKKVVSDYPTAIFRFSQGVIENWNTEEWVRYCSNLCNKENYRNTPRYSNEKPNLFYYFDTNASVQIFDIYAKWYPNNKKRVAFDLEMKPDILLYWYIGDGSLSKNSFYIATQSFTKKEVDFLCDLLFSTFGLICHTSSTEDGFILTISLKKDNLTRFFNYLDQANPEALVLAKKIYPWKFDRYLTKDQGLGIKK